MTDTTPRVGAPLLAAAQAQKHVTHNEALYQFDAFLCARFIDRTHTAPPSSPADGDTYLVAASATGAWLGRDGNVAYCADGAWRFYPPFAGLSAYVIAENKLIVWSGSAWCDFASMIAMQDLPMVGVNATADSTNKLSVQSNAVLFSDVATASGGTGDIRATLSKQAGGNTASFLFQDAFSGRAEIGLTGDDDFHFKVSPDGASWTDAMDISASTGCVGIAIADINGGTIDNAAIGASTPKSGAFTTLLAGPLFSSQTIGSANPLAQVASTATTASLAVMRASANAGAPVLMLAKSRGAAPGTLAAVATSDRLGQLQFIGDDGATYNPVGAEIRATVSGTVSTGVVPTALALYTANASGALTQALALDSSQNATFAGQIMGPVQNNITAHAGGGQASATQLTAMENNVTTVATAADSVKLPASVAGMCITVVNSGTNALQLFGSGSDTINGVASGTGVSLPAGKTGLYSCPAAGKWFGGYLN
jgi:hypothetical protein